MMTNSAIRVPAHGSGPDAVVGFMRWCQRYQRAPVQVAIDRSSSRGMGVVIHGPRPEYIYYLAKPGDVLFPSDGGLICITKEF